MAPTVSVHVHGPSAANQECRSRRPVNGRPLRHRALLAHKSYLTGVRRAAFIKLLGYIVFSTHERA